MEYLFFLKKKILSILDYRIFLECPEKIRYERRLNRDITQRARTKKCVTEQFYKQVKPMHDKFVEPCKKYADIVVNTENNLQENNIIKIIDTIINLEKTHTH